MQLVFEYTAISYPAIALHIVIGTLLAHWLGLDKIALYTIPSRFKKLALRSGCTDKGEKCYGIIQTLLSSS